MEISTELQHRVAIRSLILVGYVSRETDSAEKKKLPLRNMFLLLVANYELTDADMLIAVIKDDGIIDDESEF